MRDRSQQHPRRRFTRQVILGLRLTWPILSALLTIKIGLGATIGVLEGWGVGAGIYFGSITALTIGYGDLVPTSPGTRIAAVAIGLVGLLMTAVLAAITVTAVQAAVGTQNRED